MRWLLTAPLAIVALAALPTSAQAATCSDYANQAAAQKAADTRDADGDAIYCETLPCPCATNAGSAGGGGGAASPPPKKKDGCQKPAGVQPIGFSKTKYPALRRHANDAIAHGWPRILIINRAGAGKRRDRALRDVATAPGMDRDEYPPAVGRGKGPHLERGSDPTGWKTNVRLVPSSQNRGHGEVLGAKLRRFCNGVRFKYVWY